MPGPVFLITGASSGIGAETARHAAQAGYRLVLAARSEDKLAALASEIGGGDRGPVGTRGGTQRDQQEGVGAGAPGRVRPGDAAGGEARFGGEAGGLGGSP